MFGPGLLFNARIRVVLFTSFGVDRGDAFGGGIVSGPGRCEFQFTAQKSKTYAVFIVSITDGIVGSVGDVKIS